MEDYIPIKIMLRKLFSAMKRLTCPEGHMPHVLAYMYALI